MYPNSSQMRALARRDPALGRAMKRLPAFPDFSSGDGGPRMSHYGHLARAIVYQQLAGKAAATIFGRVCALTPGSGFPKPTQLLAIAPEALRGAGLSASKQKALLDLSARYLDGRLKLRGLQSKSNDELIEHIVQVQGIGEWTAQMFLMFKLGRLDVLPTGDLGVQEGLRILDGLDERPTAKELAVRGQDWQPLASVAAWFMWRLTDEA